MYFAVGGRGSGGPIGFVHDVLGSWSLRVEDISRRCHCHVINGRRRGHAIGVVAAGINREPVHLSGAGDVVGREVIGLLPAAGRATRISPLPFSKEVYPINFATAGQTKITRPKPVCQYLLERMRLAGVSRAYVVIRDGKWDIPAYLGDGTLVDMDIAYLMMGLPFGAPYTLDQAYPFVKDEIIAFGFPDIYFEPDDAYLRLLERQLDTGADIVLGLFPAHRPENADMVDLDAGGQVRDVLIKPKQSSLAYTWIIAVWTPVFTKFMHDQIAVIMKTKEGSGLSDNVPHNQELFVGDIIRAAIRSRFHIEVAIFSEGFYLDIGVPEDLLEATYQLNRFERDHREKEG